MKQSIGRHDGVVPTAFIKVLVHRAKLSERSHRDGVFEARAALAWSDYNHGSVTRWRFLRCDCQRALADRGVGRDGDAIRKAGTGRLIAVVVEDCQFAWLGMKLVTASRPILMPSGIKAPRAP